MDVFYFIGRITDITGFIGQFAKKLQIHSNNISIDYISDGR
jgi:hypothetical protein